MKFFINQSIVIHNLKVGGISNSSVLQVGSAGSISSLAKLYNTGGYVEPAPEAVGPQISSPEEAALAPISLVPLAPPS